MCRPVGDLAAEIQPFPEHLTIAHARASSQRKHRPRPEKPAPAARRSAEISPLAKVALDAPCLQLSQPAQRERRREENPRRSRPPFDSRPYSPCRVNNRAAGRGKTTAARNLGLNTRTRPRWVEDGRRPPIAPIGDGWRTASQALAWQPATV